MRKLALAFNRRQLSQITPDMIDKFKKQRLAEAGPATVNRDLFTLSNMFEKAVVWGDAFMNPVKQVEKLEEPPGRVRYLQIGEIQKHLSVCELWLQRIIICVLNTDMRKSEILNLRWRDVRADYAIKLHQAIY